MRFKRLWHTIRIALINSSYKRADYLRDNAVFAHVGENTNYMPRRVPLYGNLIKLGDNVSIASGVSFLTHDTIHTKLNHYAKEKGEQERFKEALGCIEIGNNVFVGANCIISNNVHIGDNVIVVSGSLITNDVPSNSVVRGNPAKRVCSFEDYYNLSKGKDIYPNELFPINQDIPENLKKYLWEKFYSERHK